MRVPRFFFFLCTLVCLNALSAKAVWSDAELYSAYRGTNDNEVILVFSEGVQPASGRFSFSNGATVLDAQSGEFPDVMILTLDALPAHEKVYVNVDAIQDIWGFTKAPVATHALIAPAGVVLWMQPGPGMAADDAGLTYVWSDQSANGNHALQFNETKSAPIKVDAAINGWSALRFDGVNDFMEVDASPSLALTNDLTIFVVARFDDFAAPRELFGKTFAGQPAPFEFSVVNGAANLQLGDGTTDGSSGFAATTSITAAKPHILMVTVQNGTVAHFLDGLAAGGGAIQVTPKNGATGLRIGGRGDSGAFMKGDIAEILVFNAALPAEERLWMHTYLGAKFVPLQISKQPLSFVAPDGSGATFSVEASAGPAALEYQWQRKSPGAPDFENMPGETDASLHLSSVVRPDNGSKFRVIISALGQVLGQSSEATLTIVEAVYPTIQSIERDTSNPSQIRIVFSTPVSVFTATNPENFSILPPINLSALGFGASPNIVLLTATGLQEDSSYQITIHRLQDAAIPPNQVNELKVTLPRWRPVLSFFHRDQNNFVASWPVLGMEYAVETTTEADAAHWTEISPTLTQNQEIRSATLLNDGAQHFYRLRRK
jgi:hypothetical protein